ncbi:hypothetical protein, partial [Oleiphilus sp. HI0079]
MIDNAHADRFDPTNLEQQKALERFEARLLATYGKEYPYERKTIHDEISVFKDAWELWAKHPPALKYYGKMSTHQEKVLLPRKRGET